MLIGLCPGGLIQNFHIKNQTVHYASDEDISSK